MGIYIRPGCTFKRRVYVLFFHALVNDKRKYARIARKSLLAILKLPVSLLLLLLLLLMLLLLLHT